MLEALSTYLDPKTLQVKALTAQNYAPSERDAKASDIIVNYAATAPIANETNT